LSQISNGRTYKKGLIYLALTVFLTVFTTAVTGFGNIGDNDFSEGESDLDCRIHRWLNPVAKVVIAK